MRLRSMLRCSGWRELRQPHWLALAYATGAVLALTATPARADGLSGVFSPPIGLALTLGIAALEAPILARIVGGRRPWLVSLVANLLSAAAGFWLVGLLVLRDMVADAPPLLPALVHLSLTAQNVVLLGTLFVLTLAIEMSVAYAFWRKRGARKVALGVLAANVASYALLVPIMLASTGW